MSIEVTRLEPNSLFAVGNGCTRVSLQVVCDATIVVRLLIVRISLKRLIEVSDGTVVILKFPCVEKTSIVVRYRIISIQIN